jgi:hypothetical protein
MDRGGDVNDGLAVDRHYRNVPRQQFDQLVRFRADLPGRNTLAQGVKWEYIASGHVASIAKLDEYVAVIRRFLWASASLQGLQAAGTTPRSEGSGL